MTEIPAQAQPNPIAIEIPQANAAWKLILQSGAVLPCTVGIRLEEFLKTELGLSAAQLEPVDALILNGLPVDEPEQAVVPDQARLALAAGLPGIVGLAMRKGSAVRALRSGLIPAAGEPIFPRPGRITLFLYSLTLPQLAGHFLKRGVMVSAEQVARYSRFAPEDLCLLEDRRVKARELAKILSACPAERTCRLMANVMS